MDANETALRNVVNETEGLWAAAIGQPVPPDLMKHLAGMTKALGEYVVHVCLVNKSGVYATRSVEAVREFWESHSQGS